MEEGAGMELDKTDEEKSLLNEFKAQESAYEDAVLRLSRFYSKTGRPITALSYMKRLSASTAEPEKKAFCFLSMGQLMEQSEDFDSAISYYTQALVLEPVNNCSWYFIHNNLGCCLNHFARYQEAEEYCRDAIRIDGTRYNAYVNLGVSLEGQGEYAEAAKNFIKAVKTNADDPDVLDHLEDLVASHEEIGEQIQDLSAQMKSCRDAVRGGEEREA